MWMFAWFNTHGMLLFFLVVTIPMPIVMPITRQKDINTKSSPVKIIRVHVLRILLMVCRKKNICARNTIVCWYLYVVAAKHDTTLVDREETPRMPWHDLSCAVVCISFTRISFFQFHWYALTGRSNCTWCCTLVHWAMELSQEYQEHASSRCSFPHAKGWICGCTWWKQIPRQMPCPIAAKRF